MENEDSEMRKGTGSALQKAPTNQHQLDEHLTDGFKASGTSPPAVVPKTFTCSTCGTLKGRDQFYSKGKGRIDSSCIPCVLKKKKDLSKRKRTKAALLKAVRKNSLIVTYSEDQVIEKMADNPNTDVARLDSLLRQFIFDSLCRNGDEND